ncbi:MAG: sarcosine oxidase subunit alpha family protein [Paracoccaceae bacterium]
MSSRLENRGKLLSRQNRLNFLFNGEKLWGYQGDTIASALLANGKTLVGRSFKYHRPRGIVASGVEEPNAIMGVGEGKFFQPNQRATNTLLKEGMVVNSQNHWPSLNYDIWSILSIFSSFFSAGFYYKIFIKPRFAWKYIYEPFIRLSAGLGKPPRDKDGDKYEQFYTHVDILIVGGGLSGLEIAQRLAVSGSEILLLEQLPYIGGRSIVDQTEIDGMSSQEWVKKVQEALQKYPNIKMRTHTVVAGIYDHGYVIANESITNYEQGENIPKERLWRIRAKKIITATGAIERPLVFSGNDIPGVMLASAARDYLSLYGVSVGDRTIIVTNNDSAYKSAAMLLEVGLTVSLIIDVRREISGDLPRYVESLGVEIKTGGAISGVIGKKHVEAVEICNQAGEGAILSRVECDAVLMSGGWNPVVNLWSHCGGKLDWDPGKNMFVPNEQKAPIGFDGLQNVFTVGSSNGFLSDELVLRDAEQLAAALDKRTKNKNSRKRKKRVKSLIEAPTVNVVQMPQAAGEKFMQKSFLDFQNDVKVTDIRLAAREGFESVEHTKRYTTLGMATDQGKLSNIPGISILAKNLGKSIPEVGTTTFRPPYIPISLGSIGGAEKGNLFKPIRKTPMDSWHESNGASWEPVGDWRRPYAYIRSGEDLSEAISREVKNTRMNVGLLDASTLGKILVSGKDSGKFLDLIYTNMMSSLAVGKCRYGLMCNENGFLFDDGVVVRLSENSYLCHTTTGGALNVHSWMEEWHQTEWWSLDVFITDVTEQYSQIAIVGPKARDLITQVSKADLSDQKIPFMTYKSIEVSGITSNIFRISFSGELSYELAVPANMGLKVWKALIEKGKSLNLMPYGTEALHVMRAEKGFIMIGDETDGTVIPQDLNLDWAISKKKKDYLGKRAHERPFFNNKNRKKLVGLITDKPNLVLPDGAQIIASNHEKKIHMPIGHITSTYFSPSLGYSIAMALIEGGLAHLGGRVKISLAENKFAYAKVVNPNFLDSKER